MHRDLQGAARLPRTSGQTSHSSQEQQQVREILPCLGSEQGPSRMVKAARSCSEPVPQGGRVVPSSFAPVADGCRMDPSDATCQPWSQSQGLELLEWHGGAEQERMWGWFAGWLRHSGPQPCTQTCFKADPLPPAQLQPLAFSRSHRYSPASCTPCSPCWERGEGGGLFASPSPP